MKTRIKFLGLATFQIVNRQGVHILLDPFITHNPVCPIKVADLEQVDLILVSHGAFDHLGDTAEIAKRFGAPVICGPEVRVCLLEEGVPSEQIQATVWGMVVEERGIRIRPVESRHLSFIQRQDGSYVSGLPLGMIIHTDPGVRIYQPADTTLFTDMRLIGELYRPNIGLYNVSVPKLYHVTPPAEPYLTGEMTGKEAAIAAQWIGAEHAIAMHFESTDEPDVKDFVESLKGHDFIKTHVLEPGEVFEY